MSASKRNAGAADDASRAAYLRREILEHDRLYYLEGKPRIADAEYDSLFAELVAIEKRRPDLIASDSPTRRVGAPLPEGQGFAKVAHEVPMLSIESLFTAEEVREFEAKVRRQLHVDDAQVLEWVLEPKFDGVSAALTYERGRFVRGLTRGDGATGEDITANLSTVRTIPLQLQGDPPELLEVRGEVLIRRDRFAAFNRLRETRGEPRLANPRNACAGALRRNHPAEVRRYPLEFYPWAVARLEGVRFGRYSQVVAALASWGFTLWGEDELASSIERCLAYHDELEARRDAIPFDVDGIIAKLDDLRLRERLGTTARSVRWQFAHKFAALERSTILRAIEVQVGNNGRLTPRAHLDPVEVGGVVVRHTTLHNAAHVASLDLHVGDRVFVHRAGDVIPQVIGVAEAARGREPADWQARIPAELFGASPLDVDADGAREEESAPTSPSAGKSHVASGAIRPGVCWRWREQFSMPSTCPACGTPVVAEGRYFRCPNVYGCPPQVFGRTVQLAGRGAFEIEGLGEKQVRQLYEAGLLETPADVFFLGEHREELLALDRWGEKSVANLLREIESRRRAPLDRVLVALAIPEVGAATARLLAERFGSLDALREAGEAELLEVHGIGPELAAGVTTWFGRAENARLIERLLAGGVEPIAPRAREGDGPFAGKSVVFTGTLEGLSRPEAKRRVEELGGRVLSSVSAKTDILVVGGKPGSKARKAEELGVSVMLEEEFLAAIAHPGPG